MPQAPPTSPPIVLPRPNLGPEPWPAAEIPWWWIAAAVFLGGVFVAWRLLQRRNRGGRPKPAHEESGADDPPAMIVEPSVDPLRAALAARFGPAWRARTTEEVAASAELAASFGGEVAEQVVNYLSACDRIKFSREAAELPEDLASWAAEFAREVLLRAQEV